MSTWKKVITEANTIGDLTNVDDSGTTTNYVLTWDGSNWVPAAAGANFAPALNTSNTDYFAGGALGTVATTLTADASLNLGGASGAEFVAVDTMDSVIDFDNVSTQPTEGELDIDVNDGSSTTSLTGIDLTSSGNGVWTSGTGTLTFTNENPVINYPSAMGDSKGYGSYIKFYTKDITVEGVGISTSNIKYIKFANKVYIGSTTETDPSNVDATALGGGGNTSNVNSYTTNWLGNLSASETKTWDVSPTAALDEHIFFACPARLVAGSNTLGFNMGGIPFDMQTMVTTSSVGTFSETYNIYLSSNPDLGAHTFITSRA